MKTFFFPQPLKGKLTGDIFTKVKLDHGTLYLLQEAQAISDAQGENIIQSYYPNGHEDKVPISAEWWNEEGVYMDLEEKSEIVRWFLGQGFPMWVDQETHIAFNLAKNNGATLPTADLGGTYDKTVDLILLLPEKPSYNIE